MNARSFNIVIAVFQMVLTKNITHFQIAMPALCNWKVTKTLLKGVEMETITIFILYSMYIILARAECIGHDVQTNYYCYAYAHGLHAKLLYYC